MNIKEGATKEFRWSTMEWVNGNHGWKTMGIKETAAAVYNDINIILVMEDRKGFPTGYQHVK